MWFTKEEKTNKKKKPQLTYKQIKSTIKNGSNIWYIGCGSFYGQQDREYLDNSSRDLEFDLSVNTKVFSPIS